MEDEGEGMKDEVGDKRLAVSGWRLRRAKMQRETGNRIGCCGDPLRWRVAGDTRARARRRLVSGDLWPGLQFRHRFSHLPSMQPSLLWRLGRGRCRAKVQIGAMLLCKGAKVRRQWLVAVSGWRLAVGESQEARGDRKPDRMRRGPKNAPQPIIRSPVSL
jgi:hypothetical protein